MASKHSKRVGLTEEEMEKLRKLAQREDRPMNVMLKIIVKEALSK